MVVTVSLTHVATAFGVGGHCIGNALPLKSTRPVGMPVKLKMELMPGLTLKSNWTVRVAAATMRRQPTPMGTWVTVMRASPVPSAGFTPLEQASAMDNKTMGRMRIVRTFMEASFVAPRALRTWGHKRPPITDVRPDFQRRPR